MLRVIFCYEKVALLLFEACENGWMLHEGLFRNVIEMLAWLCEMAHLMVNVQKLAHFQVQVLLGFADVKAWVNR